MPKKNDGFNFTKSLNRLEQIVENLEDPNLDLEEGVRLLEEGVTLHKQCEQMLKSTQAKINEILKVEEVN